MSHSHQNIFWRCFSESRYVQTPEISSKYEIIKKLPYHDDVIEERRMVGKPCGFYGMSGHGPHWASSIHRKDSGMAAYSDPDCQ